MNWLLVAKLLYSVVISDKYYLLYRAKGVLGVSSEAEFNEACTWADIYARAGGHTETLPWHYVNVPSSATSVDVARDCPAPKSCVVAQIEEQAKRARKATSNDEKAKALKFVMHFVGDEHQPLHVTPANGDKGGNEIHGHFRGREANLHQVWDSGFIMADGRSWQEIAADLKSKITPAQRMEWTASTPADWANESLAITLAATTNYIGQKDGFDISPDQIAKETPVVFDRLSRAGVRIAQLLNEILR